MNINRQCKKECYDCMYYIDNKCFHPCYWFCKHCELWTPKETKRDLIIDDLTRLPHLIVGGCTGSGKSVFLSNLISCIVSKFTPEEVKLLISDLKMCEFTYAEHLPHLRA